jgi:hypothetical protein
MKKYLLNLVVAAAAIVLGSPQAGAVPTWAQSYGVDTYGTDGKANDDPNYGSGYDVPTAIAKMPDGGFVVAGGIALPEIWFHGGSVGPMGSLVRYAADGSILWQTELRQDNDITDGGLVYHALSYISQIATDAQGNIFICGYKSGNGHSTNFERGFVAKFSPAGALVWQNGIGAGSAVVGNPPQTVPIGADVTRYMTLTTDGGVAVTFGQSRPEQVYTIPALAKFDANGSLVFTKAYDNSVQYLGTTPICQSKDGSRYVIALSYAGGPEGSRYGLLLLVTDSAGNIISQRGYNHADLPGETPTAIVATNDGGFASISALPDNQGFIFRKFNADLSAEVIEKRIARGQSLLAAGDLTQTSDGGFLIGGNATTASGQSIYDEMMLKLSPSGDLLFVSILGGPRSEGDLRYGAFNPYNGRAVELTDGSYGCVTSSESYHVGGPINGGFSNIADWWVAKTDLNRKIRNFTGIMEDNPLGLYSVTGSPQPGDNVTPFSPPGYPYGFSSSDLPHFILDDLGAKLPPNVPTITFQASSPRIFGPRAAEAVVGQHFSYHILAGFFDSSSALTYSASGLPPNFVIDSRTGIISGVAQPGTETTTPIVIALQVTDGTDTATATLKLTIGDGVPVLTVNGSSQPTANLNDKPLAFAATYPGSVPGRVLSVQSSTNSSDPGSWTDLPTGLAGYMTPDTIGGHYVLNTTNYPQQNGVSFRVRVTVPGKKPDVVSSPVEHFDLASGQSRAGQTVFRIVPNGERADFDFRATQISPANGVALRVQSSKTPGDEASWTDLPSGNAMQAFDSTHFSLPTNNGPKGDGFYFRAVGSASGFVDSLSNIVGPKTLAAVNPAKVSITSPVGGSSNPSDVFQGEDGSSQYRVDVTPTQGDRPIATLNITFDGEIVSSFSNVTSGQLYTATRTTTLLGDHVIEAEAIDDLGVIARAGTAQYIRIKPAATTSMQARQAGGGAHSTAAFRREVFTVANSGGDWSDPATWRDSRGNTGTGAPTSSDFVIIGNATVKNVAGTVFAITVSGGHLNGGQLQVGNMMTISNGTFDGSFNLTIKAGAVCELINSSDVIVDGVLENRGTINIHGARGLTGVSNFLNIGKVTFQPVLLTSEQVALGLPLDPRAITSANFDLSGKTGQSFIGPNGTPLISPNGAALIAPKGAALVGNSGGTLITNDGGSLITNDGGSLITNDGGSLITNDGGSIISNDGASIISNDGASVLSDNGLGFNGNTTAALVVKNGSSSSVASSVRAATQAGGIAINGGEVDLNGVSLFGAVTLNSGVLSGSGVVYGSLSNNGGYVTPGHSAGQITVTGNFTQGPNGTLVLEAAGGAAGEFDRLQIGGTASLGGSLDLRLTNGFVPLTGDQFNPLGYSSASGSFSSVSSNAQVSVNTTGVTATLDPNKPSPSAGQPLNIATRLAIQSGDNVLIAGFIVSGPSGSSKKVLIRGLGPSLAHFGVPNTLPDPLLELHKPDGSIVSNDNWQQGDTSQIPSGFAPGDPRESAIVATLAPGNYSAVVKGAHGEIGVGIAELYDLDATSAAKLANISTRGFVNTNDDVMIGGFIVGGTEPAKILVRAIGPTLSDFGVQGALADPTLELHDTNGATIANDDWRETQEAEITATGLIPNKNQEPAILATLAPGSYTAVVRGKNNTTGIGLVEAYNLQ